METKFGTQARRARAVAIARTEGVAGLNAWQVLAAALLLLAGLALTP